MNRYGYDYGFRAGWRGDPRERPYTGDDPRMRGYDAEVGGRYGRGAAWGDFRRMNHLERDERVPERIARAAREGRIGYGGYPGPRRSPSMGRYDLNFRRDYDRRW
jgi:hypothetical protein